ncbi:MAG: branched-chain amino acid transaminase [Sphingobium sp.]
MGKSINEPDYIWHNGRHVRWADAQVHILSGGVQFGSSVFEGIRCYRTDAGPAIFRLREHLRRLHDSCRIYRIDLPYSIDALERACIDLVAANGLEDCYLRPMVMRGYGDMGMAAIGNPVETYIASWQWGSYLDHSEADRGIDVCVSSWNRPAPNTFPALAKSAGHYNNATLIKLDAIAGGFAEAIALSPDGMVSEGSGQNIFAVRDGVLITPPVDGSILSGITRSAVMEIASALGIPVRESAFPREFLYIADELFFTGTATEIAPIGTVDHIRIGDGRIGPVTERLRAAFQDVVRGRVKDRKNWLTPVRAGEREDIDG